MKILPYVCILTCLKNANWTLFQYSSDYQIETTSKQNCCKSYRSLKGRRQNLLKLKRIFICLCEREGEKGWAQSLIPEKNTQIQSANTWTSKYVCNVHFFLLSAMSLATVMDAIAVTKINVLQNYMPNAWIVATIFVTTYHSVSIALALALES